MLLKPPGTWASAARSSPMSFGGRFNDSLTIRYISPRLFSPWASAEVSIAACSGDELHPGARPIRNHAPTTIAATRRGRTPSRSKDCMVMTPAWRRREALADGFWASRCRRTGNDGEAQPDQRAGVQTAPWSLVRPVEGRFGLDHPDFNMSSQPER